MTELLFKPGCVERGERNFKTTLPESERAELLADGFAELRQELEAFKTQGRTNRPKLGFEFVQFKQLQKIFEGSGRVTDGPDRHELSTKKTTDGQR